MHGKHDVAHCVRGVTKRVTEANHAASNRLLKKIMLLRRRHKPHHTRARELRCLTSRERKLKAGKGKPAPPEASATETRRSLVVPPLYTPARSSTPSPIAASRTNASAAPTKARFLHDAAPRSPRGRSTRVGPGELIFCTRKVPVPERPREGRQSGV